MFYQDFASLCLIAVWLILGRVKAAAPEAQRTGCVAKFILLGTSPTAAHPTKIICNLMDFEPRSNHITHADVVLFRAQVSSPDSVFFTLGVSCLMRSPI